MRKNTGVLLAMLLVMPYTTKASIVSLLAEFIAHWLRANAVLATPISLTGGFLVAAMQALQTGAEAKLQAVADAEADEGIARKTRYELREAIYLHLLDYRAALRLRGMGGALLEAAPLLPGLSAGDDVFLAAMRLYIAHWRRVNASLGADPLLVGTYTLAAFEDAVEQLQSAVDDMHGKALASAEARQALDTTIADGLARCHQYVDAATIALRGNPELFNTIPKIRIDDHATPGKPGFTAVVQAPPGVVAMTVTPASLDNFARVLIRCEVGATTPTEESALLATLTDPASLVYDTNILFAGPDATMTFRAWFVDVYEHQAASDPVTVSRP